VSDLADLQLRFIESITGVPVARSTVVAHDFVRAPTQKEAELRIDIYRSMVDSRLHDVLAEDFPRVRAIVGEAAFAAVAREYLREHPSRTPTFPALGTRFPAFLRRHSVSDRRPDLADVARLDRSRNDVFDGPDDDVLTTEELPRLLTTRPSARVRLIRAARFLTTKFRIYDAWGHADVDDAPLAPVRGAQTFLVWRLNHVVRHRIVQGGELRVLKALRDGVALDELCAMLADAADGDAAVFVHRTIAQWTVDGLLVIPRGVGVCAQLCGS